MERSGDQPAIEVDVEAVAVSKPRENPILGSLERAVIDRSASREVPKSAFAWKPASV